MHEKLFGGKNDGKTGPSSHFHLILSAFSSNLLNPIKMQSLLLLQSIFIYYA